MPKIIEEEILVKNYGELDGLIKFWLLLFKYREYDTICTLHKNFPGWCWYLHTGQPC